MKATNIKGLNVTVYEETLPNGLQVYLIPKTDVKNYYITYNVKYGSLYTTFKVDGKEINIPNGVAHFLEHLTFNLEGTDASTIFANLGSESNAYTSQKITCYEVSGFDHFKENLENLLTFVDTPYYTKDTVKDEKGIICEEVKMYEDNPNFKLNYKMLEMIFKNDNRRYPVGGTVEDVEKTTLKDIQNAYNAFYIPSNMFIVITGNFNVEEANAIIMEKEKNRNNPNKKVEIIHQDEPDELVSNYEELSEDITIPKVFVAFKIPLSILKKYNLSNDELSAYIQILLNSNFGRSSELKDKLINGNIIVDGISIEKYITDKHLIINLVTETNYPTKYINEIKNKLVDLTITEDELIRKKRVTIGDIVLSGDDIDSICYTIQSSIINHDKLEENSYEIFNNLKLDLINSIAKEIKEKYMSILVMNIKEK